MTCIPKNYIQGVRPFGDKAPKKTSLKGDSDIYAPASAFKK